jgi:hypothetical protein
LIEESKSTSEFSFKKNTFILYFIVGLYPIYGVYEWGWTFSELITFYWFESFIILIDVMIRFWMILPEFLNEEEEKPDVVKIDSHNVWQFKFKRTFFILLVFLFFTMLHGAAIFSIFVNKSSRMISSPLDGMNKLFETIFEHETLFTAVIASSLIHIFLLFTNYILPQVWKTKTAITTVITPFTRLFFLHISILALGFILSFFNTDLFLLVVFFVVFKSAMEALLSSMKLKDNSTIKGQIETPPTH